MREKNGLRGLHTVRLTKESLIARLRENRNKHREEFEAGLEVYREAVLKELEEWLEDARKGKRITAYTQLRAPEDHTTEYDQAIEMLEFSLDEELELSAEDFAQYVRDDWGWKRQFTQTLMSNTTYVGG